MKSFKINNTFNLSSLNEEVITIKKIKASSMEDLLELYITVTKKYDNATQEYPISTIDRELLYTKVPEININHKITECTFSTLTIVKPLKKSFEIFYETLEDKLNRLLEEESNSRVNIDNEVKKWQKSINLLLQNILEWIEPYKNKILIEKEELTIKEEQTGAYKTTQFTIKPLIGKQIMFKPRGTFIIGAKGRIDIYIPNYKKDLMLILNRTKDKDSWSLIVDKNRNNKFDFTKSQFINLLDDALTL
jgi:hypothetical protein